MRAKQVPLHYLFPSSSSSNHHLRPFFSSFSSSAVAPVMDESAGAVLYPLHRCKIVHLVRHGESVHNVEGEKDRSAYFSPKYFDAPLTPLGWKQVEDLRKHVQFSGLSKKLDLIVVSPPLRAMQTAVGAFGGEEYIDGITALPLMVANAGNCDHSAISSVDCPPFLGMEKCREKTGMYPCGKRRTVGEYIFFTNLVPMYHSKELFPAIDFSLIENDQDILWSDNTRETNEDLAARVVEFIQWLWTRKEKEIAIVTHSVFIYHLLRNFTPSCSSLALDKEFREFIANCEIRSLMLVNLGMLGSDCSPTNTME